MIAAATGTGITGATPDATGSRCCPRRAPRPIRRRAGSSAPARRLRRDISEVFGHPSDVSVVAPGGLRKGTRYVVRVINDGEHLARVDVQANILQCLDTGEELGNRDELECRVAGD